MITWEWRTPLLLFVCTIPCVLLSVFSQPEVGLAGLIGLLPAAFCGVMPKRKNRKLILIFGALLPVFMLAGCLSKMCLGRVGAAIAIALIGYLAAQLTQKGKWVGINMVAPIACVGLSYSSPGMIFTIGVNFLILSAFAYLVSLVFPEFEAVQLAQPSVLSEEEATTWGLLYGFSLMAATLIGFSWDHPGWLVGTVGFVMRPSEKMQEWRSLWRIVSILSGTMAISMVMFINPHILAVATFSAVMLILLGGVHRSKAYINPFFITCIVFSLVLYPPEKEETILALTGERVLWVIAGVLVAYVFGLLIPKCLKHFRKA